MSRGQTVVARVLIAAVTCCGLVLAVPAISYTALETLVNMEATFTITSLANNSVPVYRKGLASLYVAYWQVVINDKHFAIVSAGPDTGDYRLIYEGNLPTFTSQLNDQSAQRCAKYFMLAPDAIMMCEDVNHKVVATTQEPTNMTDDTAGGSGDVGVFVNPLGTERKLNIAKEDKLHQLVQSGLDDTEVEFRNRAEEVRNEWVWEHIRGVKSAVQLSIGETVKLPVLTSARIVAMGGSSQHDVCVVTRICDDNDKTLVSKDAIKTTSYGVNYVEFDVKRLNKDTGKSVSFRIMVAQARGEKMRRRYVTSQVLRRARRAWTSKCIPHESLFPDYKQFKYGSCAVGCGPVAWASVFGYLDRRSHTYSYNPDCKKLYRSGSNGMTGSSATKAPSHNDSRMRKYISRLHKILGTWCLFGNGATYAGRMGRIKSFYTSRVSGGKLHLAHGGFWSLFAVYRTKYRDYAIKCIKAGFPAIIGWKINGKLFKQHYPIATCYRWKQRRVKKCSGFWWWRKCKWVWVKEYQFYLHMGWGGTKNGWYTAKAYMSACVWY